jgi:hypothetical protein
VRLLPGDQPAHREFDQLCRRLGGVENFDLMVPARSPARDPSRLQPLIAELKEQPGIADRAGPVQCSTAGAVAVPFRLQPDGSSGRVALFDACERIAMVHGFDDLRVCGAPVQAARDADDLESTLLGSFGLTVSLLLVASTVGLRSLRCGLVALLPSLLSLLWLYGGLGLCGQPISVPMAMIACTMSGLIAGNALYLLRHLRVARTAANCRRALRQALDHCGAAIVASSTALVLGFAIAACSPLRSTSEFALLAAGSAAGGLLTTVALLPLPMLLSRNRRLCRSFGGFDAQ